MAALLLLPHFLQSTHAGLRPGAPRVSSGDEPHYLVLVNSLLHDLDLDLSNNYASVYRGGVDAGRLWSRLRGLDNHTTFFVGGRRVFWHWIYDDRVRPERWPRDGGGGVRPVRRAHAPAVPPGTPEYSTHQPGIAFLLAPLLAPLRGTRLVESAALVCSGLAVIGAFLCLRALFAGYGAGAWGVHVAAAAAVLGTPAWFYGRSLFMESFLLFFVCGAYAAALRWGAALLPGVLLGLAVQCKCSVVVVALPLAADYALRREGRMLLLFLLPLAASAAAVLVQNHVWFGGYLTGPQPFVVGSFWEGGLGLWFSPVYGALLIAPAVAVALCGWPRFVRSFRREACLLGAGFLSLYGLMGFWGGGWHGNAYGPRYLVPVLPLLFAPLALPCAGPFPGRRLGRLAVAATLLLSAAINGYAALRAADCWGQHPVAVMASWPRD